MGLFTALSKSEQILDTLRRAIKDGTFPPESKLNSIRHLAEEFSVSTKTVLHALDILAAENLIRKEHGRGIFIAGKHEKKLHEIVLAGYHSNHIGGRYFDFLSRLALPPNRRPDFNFTIRSLGANPENLMNFGLEMRKLIEYMNTDCILINAPSLGENEIQTSLKLSVPVIFLGDFKAGLYPGIDFSQVTGDNMRSGAYAVKKLFSLTNERQFIVFTGSREHYFNRYSCEGVLAAAEQLGIRIHLVEFPKGFGSVRTREEQNIILMEQLVKLKNSAMLDYPLLDLGVGELLDRGFSMLRHTGILYSAEPADNGCFNFFQTINRQIDRLLKNSTDHQKFCIEMDTVLKKRRIGF